MPRLLIVTTVPITLRSFLWPFAEHFRAKGWYVDAMSQNIPRSEAYLRTFHQVWDVSWSRNPRDWHNFSQIPYIRKIVARNQYDLVHVHTPVAAFITRYALRKMREVGKPKVIYTAHGFHFHRGGSLLKNIVFLALEKISGYWTDYLVVINKEDETAARYFQLVPMHRIRYIPGIGIDTSHYSQEKLTCTEADAVRSELGLRPSDHLFLMIAGFDPGKRHRDAVKALAQLRVPGVHLAFAGDGPLFDQIVQMTRDLGIDDKVHFLGFRDDIPSLIRASTATLLPSEREGLPRSVMESLSLTTPVIGTDIRGIRDLLGSGGGILVKVGDVHGLARAIGWAVQHPNEMLAMGKEGRAQMVAAYDLRLILKQYEELYIQALQDSYAY